jgi:vacuolar-type H+-ATPase subunit E/Vma4
MAAQSVTERIIEDARKEAQAILAKHEQEAGSIADDFAARIADKNEEIEKEISERRNAAIMRAVSQHRINLSMKRTAHKQALIRAIVDEAVSGLPGHKDYPSFLRELIKESGEKQGELLVSKEDFARYRGDLEKFLRREGLEMKITVDAGIKGGIVIKHGVTSYLGSLDIITEILSDEMAIAISGISGQII